MAEPIVEFSTETVSNVARTEPIKVLHVDDDQAFLKVAQQCLDTQGEFSRYCVFNQRSLREIEENGL